MIETSPARLCAGLLLIIGLSGCSEQAPTHADIIVSNVTVIDARSPARPNHRVVIEDGSIIAVQPESEPNIYVADSSVDGSGSYLIPGLWDMHVHFLYEPALTATMASDFLHYGVTSVRDTGGNVSQLSVIADQLAQQAFAPQLFYSGPLLDGRFVVYDGGDPGRPELGTAVADTEVAASQVASLQASGASFIKIYELVDPVVYQALADAARSRGMPIASHVPLMMTADEAGPLADSMEHLRNIELACAAGWSQLLAQRQQAITGFTEGRGYDLRRQLHTQQRLPAIADYDEARCNQVLGQLTNTLQVPTLRLNTVAMEAPFNRNDWPRALARLPEDVQQSWSENAARLNAAAVDADHTFAQWSLFLIERLLANNVPIAAGTDTPIGLGIPGYSLHTELELLVKAGMSPQQAIGAATLGAARFFSLDAEIGAIAPGMRADLVLLDADPLEDISNTRAIAAVMLQGRWVPRD